MSRKAYTQNGYGYPQKEKAKVSTLALVSMIVIAVILIIVTILAIGLSKSKKKAEKEGSNVYEHIANSQTDTSSFGLSVGDYLKSADNLQIQISVENTVGNDAYFLGKLAPYYDQAYISITGTLTDKYFEGWIIAEPGSDVVEDKQTDFYLYISNNTNDSVYFYIDESGTYVAAKNIFRHYETRTENFDENMMMYALEYEHLFKGNELFRIDDGCSGAEIKNQLKDAFYSIKESNLIVTGRTNQGNDAIDVRDGGFCYMKSSAVNDLFRNLHGNCEIYSSVRNGMSEDSDDVCTVRGIGDDINFMIEMREDHSFIGNKELTALSMDEYMDRVKDINETYGLTPIK